MVRPKVPGCYQTDDCRRFASEGCPSSISSSRMLFRFWKPFSDGLMADERSIRQFLQLMKSSGVTHVPLVTLPEPSRTFKPVTGRKQTPEKQSAARIQPQTPPAASVTAPEKLAETVQITSCSFDSIGQKGDALTQLSAVVSRCQRCSELAERRKQTVFGVGNPDARVMFVGEAPGADEDRQGEPFVGAAGQLLNKIIEACGWKRDDIYICNILRCRPPGNRNPRPQEAANCREFLDAQIKVVQPEYIVCWGTVAAQNLLNETRPVGRLRSQLLRHGDATVVCTYHPSYLLRNPSAKKQVWEDMKFLMAEMEKRG